MTNKPKSPKTGTAPARAPSVKPRYLTAGTFYRMGLHEVVTALKVIEEEGRREIFLRAAKRNKAFISVDARTVNFVKNFFVQKKMHQHPVGRHIVNARGALSGDPYKPCNFGKE